MHTVAVLALLLCCWRSSAQERWKVTGRQDMIAEAGTNIEDIVSLIRFQCNGRTIGYHADKDFGCEVFHYCNDFNMKFSYKCSDGRKFDEKTATCTYEPIPSCGQKSVFRPSQPLPHKRSDSDDFQPADFFNAFASPKTEHVSRNEVNEKGRSIEVHPVKRESKNNYVSHDGLTALSAFAPLGKLQKPSTNNIQKVKPIERSFGAEPRDFEFGGNNHFFVNNHPRSSFQNHRSTTNQDHFNIRGALHTNRPQVRTSQRPPHLPLPINTVHRSPSRPKANDIFENNGFPQVKHDPWRSEHRDNIFKDPFHDFPDFEEDYHKPETFPSFNHNTFSGGHPSSHVSFTPPGHLQTQRNKNSPGSIQIHHPNFETSSPRTIFTGPSSTPAYHDPFSGPFRKPPIQANNIILRRPASNLHNVPSFQQPQHFSGITAQPPSLVHSVPGQELFEPQYPTRALPQHINIDSSRDRERPTVTTLQANVKQRPPNEIDVTTESYVEIPATTTQKPRVPQRKRINYNRRPVIKNRRRRPQQVRTTLSTSTTTTTEPPFTPQEADDYLRSPALDYYDDYDPKENSDIIQDLPVLGTPEITTLPPNVPHLPVTTLRNDDKYEQEISSLTNSTKSPMEKFRELTNIHRPKSNAEQGGAGDIIKRRKRPKTHKKSKLHSKLPSLQEETETVDPKVEQPTEITPKSELPKKKKALVTTTRNRPTLQEIRERLKKSRRNSARGIPSVSKSRKNTNTESKTENSVPRPNNSAPQNRRVRPARPRRRKRPIRRNRNGEPILQKEQPEKGLQDALNPKSSLSTEPEPDTLAIKSAVNKEAVVPIASKPKKRRRLSNPNARAKFRQFLKRRRNGVQKDVSTKPTTKLNPVEDSEPQKEVSQQIKSVPVNTDPVAETPVDEEPIAAASEARYKRLSSDVEFQNIDNTDKKPVAGKPFRYLLNRSRNSQTLKTHTPQESVTSTSITSATEDNADNIQFVSPITSHTIVHPTDFKQVVEMSPRTPLSDSKHVDDTLPILNVKNYQLAPLYNSEENLHIDIQKDKSTPSMDNFSTDMKYRRKNNNVKNNLSNEDAIKETIQPDSTPPDHLKPFFDLANIQHHSPEKVLNYVRPQQKAQENLKILDSHPFLQPNETPRLPLEHLLSVT